jgi:molybdopterin-guanine dinucleotide biosynthesis protein A
MGAVSKPGVELGGRPMIAWPLEALGAVCARVAVVAKADTELPELPAGVERWDEPAQPRHPLTGIVCALERAGGPVLVCAADMPFVGADALRSVEAGRGGARACVGRAGGHLQPLLASYAPSALAMLRDAAEDAPLIGTVALLDPVVVDVPERDATSVDTPDGVRRAAVRLRRRRRAAG